METKSVFEIWELDEEAKEAREAYDPATVKRARADAMKRDLWLMRYFANKYKEAGKNNKEARKAAQQLKQIQKSAYREYEHIAQDAQGEILSEDEIKRMFPPIMSYQWLAQLLPAE